MIINVRGTSGSGKSTVIREVMELYRTPLPFRIKGRDRPMGYWMNHPDKGRDLAVIGHYETPCGGCDTIPDIDTAYEWVRRLHNEGAHVLFEGLLLSAERRRTRALHEDGLPLLVIGMDVPLEVCLASVNERRRQNWQERVEKYTAMNVIQAEKNHKLWPIPEYRGDVKPRNTESKFKATQTTMRQLGEEDGVNVVWLDRAGATARIRKEFDI